MDEVFDRVSRQRRKFRYCAFDPNCGVYSNFSNYRQKVSEYVESCNLRMVKSGLLPMQIIDNGGVL